MLVQKAQDREYVTTRDSAALDAVLSALRDEIAAKRDEGVEHYWGGHYDFGWESAVDAVVDMLDRLGGAR